ncbi:MAG: transglutaminase domain-containing protein [Clostridiales bacterium]|jgi:transglutaminase-like putative cysteine protease|nr:transglutaminase domain-containing protein [Clostridiales bacterium]
MDDITKKRGLFARFTWMDTVFLFTVGVLLAWSLSMAVIAGTYLEFAPFTMLVRVFFIMLVLRGIFYSKGTLIFAGAVLAVAVLILIFDALLFTPGQVQTLAPDAYLYPYAQPYYAYEIVEQARYPMLTEIVNFASGTIGFITGFEFYTSAYDLAVQWSLAIGLAVFVFVFGFFWFNFFAILSTVLLFGLVLNTGFFFYNLSFYVFIFSVAAYLIRHLNLRSMGATARKGSPFVLYALPFASVCLAVAIALPTPQAGAARDFTENFIRRPFTSLNNSLQSAFAPRNFSLAQTGFGMGNTRRLGGNVTANFDIFMRINHPGPIYLTGNVFDRYTGFSWINSFEEEYFAMDFSELEANIEAFERLSSQFTMRLDDGLIDELDHASERILMWNMGHSLFGDVWRATTIRPPHPLEILTEATSTQLEEGRLLVEHDMRKFTVFTTGLVSYVTIPYEDINLLRDANGSVRSDVLLPRSARYVIYYGNLPEDIDHVELLSASRHGLYRDVYEEAVSGMSVGRRSSSRFTHNRISIYYDRLLRDYLIPRAERINATYTALPDHFPQRVTELARQVTEQAGAVTNLEKAIVLESFLRYGGGIQYSLSPGITPLDRDFVDYFLFDQRVGFCTHFASAFVTMARTLGLPTRYVEGFIVSGDADAYGYLSVINRQGHAWAEVYFEGFGWHRFDPTPTEAIFTWPEAHNPAHFYEYWDDYFMMGQYMPWGGLFPVELDDMDPAMMGIIMAGEDGAVLNMSIGQLITWSVAITTALALALFGGRAAYFEAKKMAISKKAGNNEAAVAYFHQMLRYMRLFRYEIEPHETAIAFGTRIARRIGFDDNRTMMIDLCQIFSRARYGRDEIDDEDRRRMAAAVKALDKRLWGYMGPRKYVLYKYIMCIV